MPRQAKHQRRGATAVEFALTAPILFLLFFGAYEFSRANMIRHTVDIAAYEGSRRGIIPGATANAVSDRVNEVLAPVGMTGAIVDVTPDPIDRASRQVTVNVRVPLTGNGWILPRFVGGLHLESVSTLGREGFIAPTP